MKLTIRDVQVILRDAGFYNGPISGIVGPLTRSAIEKALVSTKNFTALLFQEHRLPIAAAQAALNKMGFDAGHVDGFSGHNTRQAYIAFRAARRGISTDLNRDADVELFSESDFPRQKDMVRFYGPPGSPDATAGRVILPCPHVLAWDTSTEIRSFSCHVKAAPAFQRIFDQAFDAYGRAEYERLRLNRFGGCFNNRPMRGGSLPSTHAFGAAVDLDPERNQLRWTSARASFARPEYEKFWQIVERNGGVSLGRARNFDWMHFQLARL